MFGVTLYEATQTIAFNDVHCTCLTHGVCYLLKDLELRLLDLEREVIVFNEREDGHEEVCGGHDSANYIFNHGIETLKSESLNFLSIIWSKHLAVVANETVVQRHLDFVREVLVSIENSRILEVTTPIQLVNRSGKRIIRRRPSLGDFY